MNTEIQKYILNFFIKMPLNRKKNKKNIYVYNPINKNFLNKISCCFPDCTISKSNLQVDNDFILNSLDYYDVIIIFNLDIDIKDKISQFLDILSKNGELWIICYPISDIESRIKNNIFDFSQKIPKIENQNDKLIKETLEVVEMLLLPPSNDPPISPKSKRLLENQIYKVDDSLEKNNILSSYSKSSSFIGNKIKYYVIKKKKYLMIKK